MSMIFGNYNLYLIPTRKLYFSHVFIDVCVHGFSHTLLEFSLLCSSVWKIHSSISIQHLKRNPPLNNSSDLTHTRQPIVPSLRTTQTHRIPTQHQPKALRGSVRYSSHLDHFAVSKPPNVNPSPPTQFRGHSILASSSRTRWFYRMEG